MFSMDKATIKDYVSNIKQLADIKTSVLDNGKGRGMRIADFYNSSGLNFSVLPDRGLDIGYASYKGIPVSFLSQTGYSHPSFYEPPGLGWLRNWGGGLLTTCGLDNVGGPKESDYTSVEGPKGLHGRISNMPAEIESITKKWVNDDYILSMKGIVRDSCLFGRNIELHREIKTVLGQSMIEINDTVINLQNRTENLEILYHINVGYPFLNENAILEIPEHQVIPRDDDAKSGIDNWCSFQKPEKDFSEQVFFHNIPKIENNMAAAVLKNETLKLSLKVEYSKDSLPNFWQWKMMNTDTYVLGMEPTNAGMEAFGEEYNDMTILKGYEERSFKVRIILDEI